MRSLAKLLLEQGLATQEQLQLATMGLLTGGGDLVSNLLAAVPVDERRIQVAVAEALELAVGPAGALPEPDETLARLLPPAWASRLGAVPVGADAQGCDIAVAAPLAPANEKALRDQVRLPLRPCYVSQLRLREALAAYAGLALSPRLKKALDAMRVRPPVADVAVTVRGMPEPDVMVTIPAPRNVSRDEEPLTLQAPESGRFDAPLDAAYREDAPTLVPSPAVDSADSSGASASESQPSALEAQPSVPEPQQEVDDAAPDSRATSNMDAVASDDRLTIPAAAGSVPEALTVPAPPDVSSMPPTRSMLPRSVAPTEALPDSLDSAAQSSALRSGSGVAASIPAPPELDIDALSQRQREAEKQLADSSDTHELLACCYGFLCDAFGHAAVWTVRSDSFRVAHAVADTSESMNLMFGEDSLLLRAQQARQPVIGTLQPHEVEAAIGEALAVSAGQEPSSKARAVCVPVVIRGRAVAMLVGSDATAEVHAAKIVALTALASSASAQLTRIILERKRS